MPIEMDNTATVLRSSLPDLSLAVMLHNHLHGLHSPSLTASRLRLPDIVIRLIKFDHISGPDPVTNFHVYRAMTSTFGDMEIKIAVHGWDEGYLSRPPMDPPLLDQEFLVGVAALDRTTQALVCRVHV